MTWPPVFDGIGALFVRADNDPDVQAERIPGLSWVAIKVNGPDASPPDEILSWVSRMRRHALVGSWIYNNGPASEDLHDIGAMYGVGAAAFVIYDVEQPYKSDEGGHYEYAADLVVGHSDSYGHIPAAVTSYGGYKDTINFAAFAGAGWPIFAQAYDSFTATDAASYFTTHGGPYEPSGVHVLARQLVVPEGWAVYRPEGLDG